MSARLLVIGDLADTRSILTKETKNRDVTIVTADGIDTGIKTLCGERIEMVFISADLDLSEFFTAYREARLNTPVVAVGGADSVQNAVSAIRLGAIEFLTTPLDPNQLAELLKGIESGTSGPIAADEASQKMLQLAKKFAASDATILLRGESGTGKEVLSRYIHENSPRKDQPFVTVNCAAIPENLLESELFGHEKGAFSGAVSKRIGKFQQADKGTLLLDEISEMDMSLQAKLLRAIQERVIDPVGATGPVSVDIRLIATTNRDLEEHVRQGNFREDLYFRLNVAAVELPPLRQRPADVLALGQHFIEKFAKQYEMGEVSLTDAAREKLTGCYWKGNVRELENTIHRALLLMAGDSLDADDIEISAMSREQGPAEKPDITTQSTPQSRTNTSATGAYAAAAEGYQAGSITKTGGMIGRSMQEVEKELILGTLDYCGGNRNQAANMLGISIKALRDKLQGLENSENPQQQAAR